MDFVIDGLSDDVLGGHPAPVLTIVEWLDDVSIDPSLVLCTAEGAGLHALLMAKPPINLTSYLRWAGFEAPSADLGTFAEGLFPEVIDAAQRHLRDHVAERVDALKTTIVQRLKDEGATMSSAAHEVSLAHDRGNLSGCHRVHRESFEMSGVVRSSGQ